MESQQAVLPRVCVWCGVQAGACPRPPHADNTSHTSSPPPLPPSRHTRQGRYQLVAERTLGLASFSPSRLTRLTVARANAGGGDGGGTGSGGDELLLFNVGDELHVCRVLDVDKVGK